MAKMSNKFVAMCSVAVGLIYTGAYAVTGAQANPETASAVSSAGNTTSSGSGSSNATAAASAASNSYKDGTYTGSGRDRRGTVQVAVTIQQGKITDVQITGYVMRYSESYINPILPREVVQSQSDNVDIISGATSSSENFQYAVQQALDQAKKSV